MQGEAGKHEGDQLMALRQRRKGKAGELDLVHWFARHDIYAERGAQHKGGPNSPDVIVPDWPWLHVECKRQEGMDLGSAALELAMQQAEQDKGEGQVPVVFWRPSRKPWRMTQRLEAQGGERVLATFCDTDAVKMLRALAEARK